MFYGNALTISSADLTLNNNTITVTNLSGTALEPGLYTLISVTGGSVVGTPNATVTVKGTATLVSGATATIVVSGSSVNMLVQKTPAFSGLTASQTIAVGSHVTLGGTISTADPLYPANGETVTVTINGNAQTTTINDATGDFSINYDASAIAASGTPYAITYSYGGDNSLKATNDASTALTILVPPSVSNPSPAATTNNAGTTAIFSITQTAGATATYQWKRGANVILSNGAQVNAATISGSTSSSLTLSRVFAADADNYFCVLQNAAGSATSGTAALIVVDPAITNQPPATLNAAPGTTATISVSAVGTTNLTYQWKKDGNNIDSSLNASATNATLTLSSVSGADAGSYTVAVTNALGTGALSTGTILTTVVPPVITDTAPSSQPVAAGANATFTASLTSGASPSYQWFHGNTQLSNGTHLSGSTALSLTIVNAQDADNGSYHLVATSSGVSVTNADGILAVVDAPAITNITVATANVTNVVFTASLTGSSATYQWSTNNTALSDGSHYAGTATTNLTVINATAADVGSYTLVANNLAGNATNAASIDAPSFNVTPSSQTVNCGQNATFNSHANGTGTVAYQWYAGVSVIANQTNASLVLSNVTGVSSGNSYSVVASSLFGTNTSSPAVLTVNDQSAPVIAITGSNPATVECHAGYTDAGATASDACEGTVSVSTGGSVNANVTGSYTLTYTAHDSVGNIATNARIVNVVDTTAPTITVTGTNPQTVQCHGGFTDAGATASDACAGTVSVSTSGAVNANATGNYTLTYISHDSAGNFATNSRVVNVVDTTAPVVTVTGTNPQTIECHGGFTDAGATASDACAGTLSVTASGSVNANTVGDYTVTYSATDGSNPDSATRVVHVVDTTAPTVIVTGSNPYPLLVNTAFTDPGATASDACAGTRSVNISGTVNTNTIGNYTLTYTATDGNGNTASATRVVQVQGLKLIITQSGTNAVLSWPGSFILQKTTVLPASWVDILSATSPYTNVATNYQTYFRLRN